MTAVSYGYENWSLALMKEKRGGQGRIFRKLPGLSLLIIRRILIGKHWLSVGRQHAYAHFLKRTLGNGLGKLYATGCEGLAI